MRFFIIFAILLTASAYSASTGSLEQFTCEESRAGGPPYFHNMEIENWDYPAWDWSPDGKHIVFQRVKSETQQIYILNVLTGEEFCLSDGVNHEGMPNWSPDGKAIAYIAQQSEVFQIFQKDLENGVTTPLVSSKRDLFFPIYSPDGEKLAFIQIETEDEFQKTLNVLDIKTGEQWEVYYSMRWMGSPSWSPDGQSLYFHQHIDTGWNDIFEVSVDGGPVKNLSHNTRADSGLAQFSPDGKYMLYIHGITQSLYGQFENTEIFRKNLETGESERLTWAWRPDDGAQYSPDGQSIIFQAQRDGYREFYIMNTDGSNQRRLTHQPGGELTSTFRRDGFAAAKARYERVIQDDPSAIMFSENAMETLFDSYPEIVNGKAALWLSDVFKKTYPKSSKAFKVSGLLNLKAGNREAAFADFKNALQENAMLLDVWREIGTDQYLELLDSIPGIFVDQGGELNGMGYEMMHLGDGTGAVRIFSRIVEANPEAWSIYDSLGEAYMWLGNYEKALENYQKSLELNPENTSAIFHINRIKGLAPTK